MMPSDDYFTPDRVDEQIEHLQHPGMLDEVTDETHLVRMLEQSYHRSLDAEDRAALAHVRQRVLDKQREQVIDAGAVPVTTSAFGSVTRPHRRRLPHLVSSLAAVILVGVLLGSWFEVTHLLGKPSPAVPHLPASQSSGNLYIVQRGVAYGFDGRSGKVLWQRRLSTPNPSGSADVKIANGVVYVMLNAELYALDPGDGKQLWHVTNPDGKTYFWDVIDGGRVYLFSLDYTFSARSVTDGTQLWHNIFFTTESGYGFSVIDGSLYTLNSGIGGMTDEKLYSLDGATGQVRWNISLTQGNLLSNFVAENGVLYFSAGTLLYAVKEQSGEKIWDQPIPGGGYDLSLSYNILYVNSQDAALSSRDSRNIYALNARTGQKVWISDDGYITFDALLTQNLLLAEGPYNGVDSIVGLNPQTGSVIWQEPLAPSGSASTWWSALWAGIIDGELYLLEGASGPSVYLLKSLNPTNGHLLSAQSLTVQQDSASVIGVSHGRLYLQISVSKTANGIPYADYLFAVYRLDNGSPVWSYAMPPFPPPTSANTAPNTSHPVLAP